MQTEFSFLGAMFYARGDGVEFHLLGPYPLPKQFGEEWGGELKVESEVLSWCPYTPSMTWCIKKSTDLFSQHRKQAPIKFTFPLPSLSTPVLSFIVYPSHGALIYKSDASSENYFEAKVLTLCAFLLRLLFYKLHSRSQLHRPEAS